MCFTRIRVSAPPEQFTFICYTPWLQVDKGDVTTISHAVWRLRRKPTNVAQAKALVSVEEIIGTA